MSEEEVIKHTKKAFKVWGEKKKSFWYRLKEFALEIFIIVFAITLSIWFHNWSEHRQEQAQVKTFLLGLEKDISADIDETKDILESYKFYDSVYRYLGNLNRNKKPDMDSLKKTIPQINSNTFLRPHESRFNGFLSAGKIMTIEDDSLSYAILAYYQEVIPRLKSSEAGWESLHNHLSEYLLDNVKDFDNYENIWEVLTTPKGKFLAKSLRPWGQLLERYRDIILTGNKIIATIHKLYPDSQ